MSTTLVLAHRVRLVLRLQQGADAAAGVGILAVVALA
jgi:hypothetical protein